MKCSGIILASTIFITQTYHEPGLCECVVRHITNVCRHLPLEDLLQNLTIAASGAVLRLWHTDRLRGILKRTLLLSGDHQVSPALRATGRPRLAGTC
jgi:hypothetical protein